jgi:hypothetical protein
MTNISSIREIMGNNNDIREFIVISGYTEYRISFDKKFLDSKKSPFNYVMDYINKEITNKSLEEIYSPNWRKGDHD